MDDDDKNFDTLKDIPDSPSKRRKVAEAAASAAQLNDGRERIYVELVMGGYELYTVEGWGGQDGFFNPLREEVRSNGSFAKEQGLIMVANRNSAPNSEEILYNVVPTAATSPTKSYPRQVIVRLVDTSSSDSRKACALAMADFLNEFYWSTPPTKSYTELFSKWEHNRSKRVPRYFVPDNFDRTMPKLKRGKLAHYIVPNHVVNIIKATWDKTGPMWAISNSAVSHMFFDEPFPEVAKTTLGYGYQAND